MAATKQILNSTRVRQLNTLQGTFELAVFVIPNAGIFTLKLLEALIALQIN